ncbi:hypothetical protein F0L74_19885 [Chitinophaga agrisoli]|uniref:Uncharacterized protein n=1 Tax=Chitinophaga agrisoli TaxID=2607653 RepID=A0A5B2VJV2_9BACT|nr:hypothetical protein [Chitinophaga agrisoli]KAA2238487.1 hypothetical protein F0L74_19885 [Chitinophaga agrisoli]
MMTAPSSSTCTLYIQDVWRDPNTPGKFHLLGEIVSAPPERKDNTFFAIGRRIEAFTFSLPRDVRAGATARADVEFMGDPFVQRYLLTNLERVA